MGQHADPSGGVSLCPSVPLSLSPSRLNAIADASDPDPELSRPRDLPNELRGYHQIP
jgi:hypothetical protein